MSGNVGVVVAQKISSGLSVFGSSYIFQEIVRDRTKRSKVVFRLLACMSFSDAFCSIWFFVGSWAVPKDWPGIPEARGTELTCRIQAFILYFAVTTFNYNGCLALYYLLSIRYGWTEERIRKYVEPGCHAYSLIIGLAVGATPSIMNLFNPANFWCSIKPDELKGTKYIWFLFYVPCWFSAAFCTISMIAIYWHVRKTESRALRYDFQRSVSRNKSMRDRFHEAFGRNNQSTVSTDAEDLDEDLEAHQLPDRNTSDPTISDMSMRPENPPARRKQSRKVANQALLYCLAFYMTLTVPTTTRTIQVLGGTAPSWMLVLFMALYPLQGFLNFLIYMRPRWVQRWKKSKRVRQRRSLRNATNSNLRNSTDVSVHALRIDHSGAVSDVSKRLYSEDEMEKEDGGAVEKSVAFAVPEEEGGGTEP